MTSTQRIAECKAEIAALQEIQKTHRPTTSAWQVASELLEPLFAEMAAAQRALGVNSL